MTSGRFGGGGGGGNGPLLPTLGSGPVRDGSGPVRDLYFLLRESEVWGILHYFVYCGS